MEKSHNKRKNVVGYGRVSSAEQASSGLSLDMQRSECEKKAQKQGYEFVYFEDKGKTGSNTNRKGLKSMLKYIKDHRNEVAYVVVWKLDRLSRCMEDFYAEILKPIKKYGCTIASIMENFDDIRKVKKVLLGVYIGQAEDELDNIKDRTSSVLHNRAKNGYQLGKAPIGYLNARDKHKHGIIVPDPNKAHYIKQCFELYATGTFTMDAVGKELAKYGFVDSKNKPYPKKRIEDILKNPVYIGKVKHHEDIWDGVHKPIISDELFYRVQLMFKDTSKKRPRGLIYTYSNFIKCETCNCTMVGTTKHGAHNSGTYIYYHCSNYKKMHNKEQNINETLIDKAMQEVLESFDITDIELKKVKKQIFSAIDDLKKYERLSIEELKKQYDKISELISNIIKQKLMGKLEIDDITFNETLKKWQSQKDEISHKISNLNASSKDTTTRINILIDFANKVPELYLKATLQEKRLILSTITEKIYFDGNTNTIKVKLKPVFEYLRQRKLHNKFKNRTELKLITGTLETQVNQEEQVNKYNDNNLSNIIDFGTRKSSLNTKIEPHKEGSKKLNVDGGT